MSGPTAPYDSGVGTALQPSFVFGGATWYEGDCFVWLSHREPNSIHGVVCDPPYGLVEYRSDQLEKRARGVGGVWRSPPARDGRRRSPVPRFTERTSRDLAALRTFYRDWATLLCRALVPGAHVLVASSAVLVPHVTAGILGARFEYRGQVIRLVQTLRGGDRPKGAHKEFRDVTVMPRSQHEPWLLFRKPCAGRVQDNLRLWRTGGLRRVSDDSPFGDVIQSAPTHPRERAVARHPSLKPQAFLRHVVRAILPCGEGVICDPFAGSGSTLAAAEFLGYVSIGVESNPEYTKMARLAIPRLARYGLDQAGHDRAQLRLLG